MFLPTKVKVVTTKDEANRLGVKMHDQVREYYPPLDEYKLNKLLELYHDKSTGSNS
jgi:hypothetical protein